MGAALRTRQPSAAPSRGVRLTRAGACVAAALALLFVYYAWTATSSGNPFNKVTPFFFKYQNSDYYNLQADAFLHGRLSLDVPVDPRLLSAKNPYALDVPDTVPGLVDAPFYHGKWYLSWGPAPALTTFLPPRLLGLRIQENLAVTLYAFIGVLCGGLALTLLVRRLVPDAPRVVLWTGNAALALATALPWMLRRPTVYEVAITGAFCAMMAGLLLLLHGRRTWAGVLFGLAVLSRPSMGFVVLALVALAWMLQPGERRALLAWTLGIPIVAGVLFLIYNALRFSGPLDFGGKWQLSGRDVRHIAFNDLGNLPPALYGYLIAPLRLGLEFPYIHVPPPPTPPVALTKGFGVEPTGSVFWAVPFALLSAAFLARRVGRRAAGADADADADADTPERPVTRVILVLLAAAALALVPAAYSVPGYTERYALDFLPYLVMAATIGWAALVAGARTPRRAAWWRRGGLALAAWSVLVGVAIGFTGYYDSFKILDQSRFRALERTLSPVPTLVTVLAGRPEIAAIAVPDGYTGENTKYTALGVDGATFALGKGDAMLTIVSPGRRTVALRFVPRTRTADAMEVAQSGAGQTTSIAVHNGVRTALPMTLHRGVNYVDVGMIASQGTAAPDVRLTGVQLH